MLKRFFVAFVLMGAAFAQYSNPAKPEPQAGATIALRGGKLLTVSHGVIENGVLVMQNGKITAVGPASTAIPAGSKVIDVTGMTIYPGLIDSETNPGLTQIHPDPFTHHPPHPTATPMRPLHAHAPF